MTTRQKSHWKSVKGTNFSQRKLPLFLETEAKKVLLLFQMRQIQINQKDKNKNKTKKKNTAVANKQGL